MECDGTTLSAWRKKLGCQFFSENAAVMLYDLVRENLSEVEAYRRFWQHRQTSQTCSKLKSLLPLCDRRQLVWLRRNTLVGVHIRTPPSNKPTRRRLWKETGVTYSASFAFFFQRVERSPANQQGSARPTRDHSREAQCYSKHGSESLQNGRLMIERL